MHTYTIPSRLIKRITNYEYSHIAISLDRNCNTIYSFGRKKYTSFINGGFSVEHKSGEFFSKFKDTICRIYELDVTIEQYNALKKIINYDIKIYLLLYNLQILKGAYTQKQTALKRSFSAS